MLVVISDLHFTDGTTSNFKGDKDLFNIKPKAFELFLEKIAAIVQRKIQNGKAISSVDFVYNGDIFDPLRTWQWFDTEIEETPWSLPTNSEGTLKACTNILENIINNNAEALQWLSGTHEKFKTIFPHDIPITRTYIPGNHDRMCNLYDPMRKLIREKLLNDTTTGPEIRFDNFLDSEKYKTLVMHGHEADPFNCELDDSNNPLYSQVPIGDPMTTMLFAQIGRMAGYLCIGDDAKQRFKDIDNVRPTLATIRFVQDIVHKYNISQQVNEMLKEVVKEFVALPFYKQWDNDHDHFGWDETEELSIGLKLIKTLGTSVPAGLFELTGRLLDNDPYPTFAANKLKESDNLYCILGHTHEPKHLPLFVNEKTGQEKHYLNCGTFRTTFSPTVNKLHYLRFQRMSFAIIYGPNEFQKTDSTPMYEMWAGLRMHN